MPEPSRTAAQERADEIRVFGDEFAHLEREGVIALTPAQREAIGALRDLASSDGDGALFPRYEMEEKRKRGQLKLTPFSCDSIPC